MTPHLPKTPYFTSPPPANPSALEENIIYIQFFSFISDSALWWLHKLVHIESHVLLPILLPSTGYVDKWIHLYTVLWEVITGYEVVTIQDKSFTDLQKCVVYIKHLYINIYTYIFFYDEVNNSPIFKLISRRFLKVGLWKNDSTTFKLFRFFFRTYW